MGEGEESKKPLFSHTLVFVGWGEWGGRENKKQQLEKAQEIHLSPGFLASFW